MDAAAVVVVVVVVVVTLNSKERALKQTSCSPTLVMYTQTQSPCPKTRSDGLRLTSYQRQTFLQDLWL